MFKWLRKLDEPKLQPIHPPWKVGQYVTYFFERDDGSWVAFALRLLGQGDDGAWILCGDSKTRLGENTFWFRTDPAAPLEAPDIIPLRQESIRKSPTSPDTVDSFAENPDIAISLAMNLLMVRRWPAASEALRGQSRQVCYPCGVDQAYLLITPGPGYEKHHDINPRIMLTGVACLSVDGGKHPMTATSFGLNDPTVAGPASYDDFVDLSHLKRVVHDGFALIYPATWFLRPDHSENEQGAELRNFFSLAGGVSCSITFSVAFHSGTLDRIIRELDAILSRLSGPLDKLSPRKGEPLRLKGNVRGFIFDMDQAEIDGLTCSAVYWATEGDRLAHVIASGCISKASPRCGTTLNEMEQVFREVLESFQFT